MRWCFKNELSRDIKKWLLFAYIIECHGSEQQFHNFKDSRYQHQRTTFDNSFGNRYVTDYRFRNIADGNTIYDSDDVDTRQVLVQNIKYYYRTDSDAEPNFQKWARSVSVPSLTSGDRVNEQTNTSSTGYISSNTRSWLQFEYIPRLNTGAAYSFCRKATLQDFQEVTDPLRMCDKYGFNAEYRQIEQ